MKTTALIIAASLIGATAAMAAESTKDSMPPASTSTMPDKATTAAEAGKTMDSAPEGNPSGMQSGDKAKTSDPAMEPGKTSTSDPSASR